MTPTTPEPRWDCTAVVFAKSQPQYIPLPANISGDGCYVETKWKLTMRERLITLITGGLYLTIKTGGNLLQPVRLAVARSQEL